MTKQQNQNLALWESFPKTDPAMTKVSTFDGFVSTSINGMYMERLATEAFGPKGKGWGVDLVSERYDDGAPLIIVDQQGNRSFISTPNGPMLEKHHTCFIRLWYVIDATQYAIEAYGTTKYVYSTQSGVRSDGEAPKKSFTDAMKKALSGLGIASDIYTGLYDNAEYVESVRRESEVAKAATSAEQSENKVAEIMADAASVIEQIKQTKTQSAANGLFKAMYKKLVGYQEIYAAKGDDQTATRFANAVKKLTRCLDDHLNTTKTKGTEADADPASEAPQESSAAEPEPEKQEVKAAKKPRAPRKTTTATNKAK